MSKNIKDEMKQKEGRDLDDNWGLNTVQFHGCAHVEANILALHLLSADLKFVPAVPLLDSDLPNFLELPDQARIDRFKALSPVLPVSNRCCPSCRTLIKWLQNAGKLDDRLVYPGYHKD